MLTVDSLSFAYDTTPILKNISFTIPKGQHVALIGASGCGKSTLLKIIYGLMDVAQGTLYWKDTQLLGPAYHLVPGHEQMKYLAQGSELQAFRTVAENIGQYLSNFEPELKKGRVAELMEIVEMTAFADTKVEVLSGGQRQRVALAKALAKRPEVLLLDEPFGNIDNFRRNILRRNLFAYLTRNEITSIIATHDQTDMLSFTDQTIVIQQGEIIAQAPTTELYEHPKNHYIASLFGEVNSIPVAVLLPHTTHQGNILLYPHELQISDTATLHGYVKYAFFEGSHYLIEAVLEGQSIFIQHPTALPQGSKIGIYVPTARIHARMND